MEKDTIVLQQKIIHFKSELAKYKEKVKDYQENYHYALLSKLKKENAELLQENEELIKEKGVATEEAHRRIQGIESQLSNSQKRQEALQEEAAVWREKAERYQKNFSEISQHLSSAKKEITQVEYRLHKKEKELDEIKIEWKKSIQEYEEKASAHAARLADLSGENQSLKESMEMILQEKEELNGKVQGLESQQVERDKQMDTYKKSLHQAEETYAELMNKQEKEKEEYTKLKAAYEDKDRKFNKLLAKNESQASRLKNSLEEKSEQQATIRHLKNELEKRSATSKAFEQKLPTLQDSIQKLKQEKDKLMGQQKVNDQLLQQLKKEKEQFETNNQVYEKECQQWKKKEEEWERTKGQLEKKLSAARSELEQKEQSLHQWKAENEKLVKLNQKYLHAFSNETGDASEDMITFLDEQMKKILGQTFEYEEELDSKILFMKSLEEKIDQLGNEILELEDKENKK